MIPLRKLKKHRVNFIHSKLPGKTMFEQLTEKIQKVFKNLRGQGKLTEENIQEALKEVRLALLEADVNFETTKLFLEKVRTKALGKEVSRIQLHECRHTQTANRAESGGPVQGADTGTDEPDERGRHRTNG